MASLARIGFVLVTAAVTLVPILALADGDKDKDKREHEHDHDRDDKPPAASTGHGVNFLLKSALDANFCIQDAAGATEGRSVTMATCNGGDTQRWALSSDADGYNLMMDSQAMCVDVRGRRANDGVAVQVYKCHFGDNERFSYTASGHLEEVHSRKCLAIAAAGAGAAVALADCDESKQGQVWKLAH